MLKQNTQTISGIPFYENIFFIFKIIAFELNIQIRLKKTFIK